VSIGGPKAVFRTLAKVDAICAGVRRQCRRVAFVAALAGLAEALALLVAVRVALGLSESQSRSVDMPLVDRAISSTWAIISAGLLACGALLLHIVIARLSSRLAANVLEAARRRAVRSFLASSWSIQAGYGSGRLHEVVLSHCSRVAQVAQAFVVFIAQASTLTMFIASAFLVDVVVSMVVVVAGVFVVALLRPFVRSARRRSRAYVAANATFAEAIGELAAASVDLQVFGVDDEAAGSAEEVSGRAVKNFRRARLASLMAGSLYKDLAILLLIGCVAVISFAGDDQLADVGVVVALILRSLTAAQQMNNQYQTVNEAAPTVEALLSELLSLEDHRRTFGSMPLRTIESVELRGVSFRYGSDGPSALESVSLCIGAGEAIGLVGPSGGGKSTLVRVLLRLVAPTFGDVLVNGRDYAEFDPKSWSGAVGFVPQEASLIEGTVASNIRFFRDFDDSEVVWAADMAGIHQEIVGMPDGYQTALGARGFGLSGGQRQRVAIARALIGRPQFLLLDEPTSALDARSESALTDTLKALKGFVTVLVVTHRPKVLEACDRVVTVQGGRVDQIGARSAPLDGSFAGVRSAEAQEH
jgi:ATP-binding cassette, subfamily B, bacterial